MRTIALVFVLAATACADSTAGVDASPLVDAPPPPLDADGRCPLAINEVAAAVHRLLDATPMTPEDVLSCVDLIWNAHECNEFISEFSGREDAVLCQLLDELRPR